MYNYTVTLTNFGNVIYSGSDLATALGKAEQSGFEATLMIDYNDPPYGSGQEFRSYSPIGGWRTLSKQ